MSAKPCRVTQLVAGRVGRTALRQGEPPPALSLSGLDDAERQSYPGLPLTAMLGVNVIPAVCEGRPGVLTHFNFGVVQTCGLVRE